MWRQSLCLLLVAAITLAARASEDPTESLAGVQDLTPSTFDRFVNGGKHALVEFYAPWCGHCKHLTPEYKKLGEAVANSPKLKDRVVIAKVNADEHGPLGEKFGVRGFPTIKFFGRGKSTASPEDYSGAHTADTFLQYLEENLEQDRGFTPNAFLQFLEEKLEEDRGFARIESLDKLASAFLTASDKTGASAALKAAAEKLDDVQRGAGELYAKFAEKASTKGSDWFQTETARLERLLGSGSVGSSKASEISKKLSVLTAFMPDSSEDEGEATKAEE